MMLTGKNIYKRSTNGPFSSIFRIDMLDYQRVAMPCFIPADQSPVHHLGSFVVDWHIFLLRHTIISGTFERTTHIFKCKRHILFCISDSIVICTCELFILICRFIAVSNGSVYTQKDAFVFEFWPLAARWGSLDLNKISRKRTNKPHVHQAGLSYRGAKWKPPIRCWKRL